MDQRKQYLIQCITKLLKLEEEPRSLIKSPILEDFIDNNDKKSIALVYLSGKGFKIYKYQEVLAQDNQLITICKNTGDYISEDNINKVISISLMSSDPINQFYQHLTQFYMPALKDKMQPNMNKMLEQLMENLDNSLNGNENDLDEKNVKNINKPSDEFEFWQRYLTSVNSANTQKRIQYYINQFSQIEGWKDLRKIESQKMEELIDKTADVIDKIWNVDNSYPEIRMRKLIDTFISQCSQKLILELKPDEIWDLNSYKIKSKLIEGQKYIKYLNDTINQYVTQLWTERKWMSGSFDFSASNNLIQRINEIVEFREQYEELNKILNLKRDFDLAFNHFKSINSLSSPNDIWNTQKSKFNQQMEEIEDEIYKFFKKEIFTQNTSKENPIQVLREMQNWNGLLSRQKIMKKLMPERHLVLVSLLQICEKIKDEFESKSGQNLDLSLGMEIIPQGHNFRKF
ncbi:hypothetical protein IMG5_022740 [Ichthyophthirius multifiliis]|uniref:Dynein heavy chain tail domain-containing protein n=1 Tax=Ichthyophthirius multifiliis TaxID=5932 RepID=G0QKV6_ICHMU|nr:hypothetical protein IMG5_022740 [Ichthyophthirius multifiliis]EGR34148.1 hypothetical protein IMG5_022740 [Ichthyophthirius multifiliis]|eukprot:XP_004039452.1 hypothetical protein IMG5_022740 [Ichthyophthirius multifiliis]